MTTLHATPYNRDAAGFYFTDALDYETKATSLVDCYGNLVEEFEIQFIDGNDAELFEACGINQANLNQWFDDIEFLQDYEKVSLYYLVGVAGYNLDQALLKTDEPSLYQGNLLDAATELFDECWLPSIPESIQFYIDYDKFARDCQYGGDLTEFDYAGTTYTCTNANGL
ncbi:MAG: antirestriction protein ArdA [Methylophilaceae bacterium]|nr:antirestriction protein ArdA [Methylophilaceae bacterium]